MTPHPTCQRKRPPYVDDKAEEFVGAATFFPRRDTLLLGYQAAWVKDKSRRKLAEKSRQIGWTWASAYNLVRKLGRKRGRDNQWDAWITSRDAEQARLFVIDVLEFAGLLNIGAEDLGERLLDDKRGSTTDQVRFANSLIGHSMSSNFNAQAGKRGHRTLDEFALHEQQRQLFAIASPGVTWGGDFEIFSTHRGSNSFFNQLVTDAREKGNPKRFSLHRVTLADALEQGFLYKLQSKLPLDDEVQAMDEAAYFDYVKNGAADEESFQQEYMCVPSDDNAAFLTYDLITSCQYPGGVNWEWSLEEMAASNDPLYVGVDVGRSHDLTVIWIIQKVAGTHFTRAMIEMQDVPFSEQEATLFPILELPSVRRCCIDQSGLGRQFTERAQERFGEHRVEGIGFTMATKEEMAYPFRAAFEDANIRIPADPNLVADLRAIKKVSTAAGNVRFAADRGKNGHADRFWAGALALLAGSTATGAPVFGETVGRKRSDGNDYQQRGLFPDHSDDYAHDARFAY